MALVNLETWPANVSRITRPSSSHPTSMRVTRLAAARCVASWRVNFAAVREFARAHELSEERGWTALTDVAAIAHVVTVLHEAIERFVLGHGLTEIRPVAVRRWQAGIRR